MKIQYRAGGKNFQPSSKLQGEKSAEWEFVPRPGGFWNAIRRDENGNAVESRRVWAFEQGGKISWNISGRVFHGERIELSAAAESSSSMDDSGLTAQFPGKVRKILAQEGSKVKQGEKLMLLEAMKMEFPVLAPSDGKVKKVLVTELEQIQPGRKLVEFERG